MKFAFLIILTFFLLPYNSFSKTTPQIIKEKIISIYDDIKDQWIKKELNSAHKTILCLGFWSKNNNLIEKKVGLLFSRYLYEYLNTESYFKVVEQEQMLDLLKSLKTEDIINLSPDFIQNLKNTDIHYIILGKIEDQKDIITIQYQLIKIENLKPILFRVTQFPKKLADDVTGAYQIDKLGLLYQDTFDFNNRFFVGPAWWPLLNKQNKEMGRIQLEFGYHYSYYNSENTSKNRFQFFTGQVSLNPISFEILGFEYDKTFIRYSPLFWVTTFIGSPERYDVTPDGGFSLRVLKVQYHPQQSTNYTNAEIFGFFLPLHLWQSRDLMKYLRFRIGPGFGALISERPTDQVINYMVYPKAFLEGHFNLDQQGFHYLKIGFETTIPYYLKKDISHSFYSSAYISYEVIFMRISEQPVSLFLKTLGNYRTDLNDIPSKWELSFLAGLNFSFGVPPLVPVLSELQLRKQNAIK